jgi:predicted dehydrogenase
MPRKKIRVAVIGAGAVAQINHIPAYGRLETAEVVAVCDTDVEKAKRVAARFGVPTATADHNELFARDDIDAVDVCVPNHLHAPISIAALNAGKHVLCEKPFSRSPAEAARMVAAAEKSGTVLMAAFNNRFRNDAQLLKTFVEKGEVGHIFYAKTGWLIKHASWDVESWKSQKRFAGGGVLIDLGVQMLDLALWIMGMPDVLTVTASTARRPDIDEVESNASAFLRLDGGATLTLEVGWSLLMEKDFAYVNLFGEHGAALLNPFRLHKEMHGSLVNVTPATESIRNVYKQSYESEIAHFVDCARLGKKPLSPGHEAVSVLRVLEAIYKSAESGREVKLG